MCMKHTLVYNYVNSASLILFAVVAQARVKPNVLAEQLRSLHPKPFRSWKLSSFHPEVVEVIEGPHPTGKDPN